MQRITQYDGLYGEASALTNSEYLFSELLETRSKTFEWIIQPHIHARLFQLFFVETGQVTFQEANSQRQILAPFVLLIPPTALHGLTYSPSATGHILTISDKLVDSLLPNSSPLTPMLGAVQCLTNFEAPYSANYVRELIKAVDQELFDTQPEKQLMLRICIQNLFLVLYRVWLKTNEITEMPNSLTLQYFRKFQQRVKQVGTTYSITQLASDLAITPVHLNRICQAVVGKSASQVVQEHILEEARKYLTYTTYSVSEIAYLLNFEYPTYFARFFRKHLGLSPSEFRERKR